MLALDLDQENTPNSQVLYFLVSQTPVLRESGFRIDRVSGEIRLSGCLDYEVMCTLLFWKNKMASPSLSTRHGFAFAVRNPLWLDWLLKLLKWNISVLYFLFPCVKGFTYLFLLTQTAPRFTLVIGARDCGNPPLSSTATVHVHVQDSNNHMPRFTQDHVSPHTNSLHAPGSVCWGNSSITQDTGNLQNNFS